MIRISSGRGWRRGRSAGRRRRTRRARSASRSMSKRCGSSKTSSSRLAEMYQSTTLSPSWICLPPSSMSAVAVRRKYITGDAQRSISSTAPVEQRQGRPSSVGALVGVLDERQHPVRDQVARRLVAGDGEQQEEQVELELGEPLAVDLGLEQHADDVVAGVARASRRRARSRTMNISVAASHRRPRSRRRTRGRRRRSSG